MPDTVRDAGLWSSTPPSAPTHDSQPDQSKKADSASLGGGIVCVEGEAPKDEAQVHTINHVMWTPAFHNRRGRVRTGRVTSTPTAYLLSSSSPCPLLGFSTEERSMWATPGFALVPRGLKIEHPGPQGHDRTRQFLLPKHGARTSSIGLS